MYSPIHLVFYLLTLLLSPDVTEFTVTAGLGQDKQQATWTKTDKGWLAKSSTGENMGIWSVPAPLTVVVVDSQEKSSTTSFKELLSIKDGEDKKPKAVLMAGNPVKIEQKPGLISFLLPDYDQTLVVTYVVQKPGASQ